MKFEDSNFCPPLRLVRVERVSVQHRRRSVGRLRARHRSRRRVRQALAAVQRRNAAPLARPEYHHRVHPPGDQRNRRGAGRAPAGLGLPRISARHAVRLGASLSAVFLFTEALLGAALVLLEHVAGNQSSARAYSLSAHLLNTLTLLACLTLTAWWATHPAPSRIGGRPAWMAAISLALVMILGVSGAIAALGDTLFPSRSLAEGLARDFDPAASIFVRLRILHPVIAALAAAWLFFYSVTTAGERPALRPRAWMLFADRRPTDRGRHPQPAAQRARVDADGPFVPGRRPLDLTRAFVRGNPGVEWHFGR